MTNERGIGDNRPPSEIGKLQAIEAVLEDDRLTQTDALVTIGLIIRSDGDYANAFPGGARLARYAKLKRTDGVFLALRRLETDLHLIERESRGRGRTNLYKVVPQRVIDAVAQQYAVLKAAKAQATHPFHPGGSDYFDNQPAPESHPHEPGDPEIQPTRMSRTPASEGRPPQAGTTHPVKAGATHPAEPGRIHSLSIPDPSPLRARAPKDPFALNPTADGDVSFHDGHLQLLNGARTKWADKLGGDEQLDLALIEVANYVEPHGNRPLIVQVESQLARRVRDKLDRDARYSSAAGANQKPPMRTYRR